MADPTDPLFGETPDDGDHKGFVMRSLETMKMGLSENAPRTKLWEQIKRRNERIDRAIAWVELQPD